MLSVASFFLLLAVLVSPSQEHPSPGTSSCALDFQEALNKTSASNNTVLLSYIVTAARLRLQLIFYQVHMWRLVFIDPCKHLNNGFIQGYSQARCDMDSGNGGWLVIQRRVENGTVHFNRGWSDYEEGFGDLEGEFWYGLKNIHCLTNSGSMELRMDMEHENGEKITWTYQEFHVEGPENKYQLHIGGGEGTPGISDIMVYDSLHQNLSGMYFSTKDRDNDRFSGNCAQSYRGGFWYNACTFANPNGDHDSSIGYRVSIYTWTTKYSWAYYPNFEMKIRPKSCTLTQACV